MENNPKTIILNVDDDDGGRYAISRTLHQAGFDVKEASNGKEALRFAEEQPDLIILDVNLPDIRGFDVCRMIKNNPLTSHIPVLHLSATYLDDESKVRGLETADGYLTQPVEPPVLIATIKALLRMKRAEKALRESEAKFRTLVEQIPAITYIAAPDEVSSTLYISPQIKTLLDFSMEEWLADHELWLKQLHPDDRDRVLAEVNRIQATREPFHSEYRLLTRDGRVLWFRDEAILVRNETGKPLFLQGVMIDITERKEAEETLRRTVKVATSRAQENAIVAEIGRIISSTLNIEEVYERFAEEVSKCIPFDRIAINIINHKEKTVIIPYVFGVHVIDRGTNDVFPLAGSFTEEVMRTRSGLLIQTGNVDELKTRFPELLTAFEAGLRSMISVPLISKNQVIGSLYIRSLKPNAFTETDVRLAERVGNQIAGAIANAQLFAERMGAEEAKIALEEQFRQSQKMEAIGRLAGGIAHDFNNLLTIIKGYSQLTLLGLKEGDPLMGRLDEIRRASDRASDLTRQLLAFSRRQILELKVLDLNTGLRNLENMLRRVIGEDIELVTYLVEDLGRVKTDPGQIEQVIMNLAINARDAMPDGGKLTIETANVELDEKYARNHVAVKTGRYVMLAVSDTGVGMAPEVKERVFEPFFTTKEKGRGTGLGLSTVYGIVKQSEGNIWVYSELGHGTTFKIYLPRVDEPLEELRERVESKEVPRGDETILVVEDEKEVRKLAVQILETQGYKVLEASQGLEAFTVCEEHEEPIHLLVTDVVMPKMSGRELAEHLASIRPEIKVLYMSGYTDNAIVHHGVLAEGVNFIQKPFTPDVLARKVREVLDK